MLCVQSPKPCTPLLQVLLTPAPALPDAPPLDINPENEI